MDNINILELIYSALKDIKSAKSMQEYNDIVIDIEKINMVLNFGYINETINGFIITKSMQEVYNELLNKYEGKNDWGCSGYYAYHQKYVGFNLKNGIYAGANNNVRTSLYNLRGWIIRYFAYKVCKDKFEEKIEELFLKDNADIKNEQELCDSMIILDGKILETISKYKD